jgi:alpha-mannosidase
LIQLHYSFKPEDTFDAGRISQEAQTVANPVIIHPLAACKEPSSGQFIRILTDGIRVLYVKETEDRKGKIVRLMNLTNKAARTNFELPKTFISGAWRCSTTECKLEPLQYSGNQVGLMLQPREIVSIRIE